MTQTESPNSKADKSDDDQKQHLSSGLSFAAAGAAAIVMLVIMTNYCRYSAAYMGGIVALVNGVILSLLAGCGCVRAINNSTGAGTVGGAISIICLWLLAYHGPNFFGPDFQMPVEVGAAITTVVSALCAYIGQWLSTRRGRS
jgi:VIT1/CCC1 family predicted Fe2+/Mn2+ transporter